MEEIGQDIGVSDEERLAAVEHELRQVSAEIQKLSERKSELTTARDKLRDKMSLERSKQLADKNWDRIDFPWYSKLQETLRTVFRIQEFRPHQLPTMNATLSREDAILIMPTGGGKSLAYQLTAVVDKGFTLVVSPLLSLMEDQVIALKALNIDAGMFHAQSDKAETNRLMQALTDPKSSLKLIYATPEKLAKSKRFMSKLQKAYQMGRLARIAIDEVHCCSQWGHDFRPDYKFLGVLKPMFPDVPILGLTATATSKVIIDVQKMLDVQGCIVFRATFNRPNLYYELRLKPSAMSECVEQLADLLKHRFANQSGIIYTTSIKDCDELRDQLRQRGLRVSGYHATLDAALRSKIHRKWLTGEYQAVVATIAFGLGIDKPDVRFVIHHALSKSMENFYQESGRAGRDGKSADCILFYRLADVFKLSTMVFTQQTGLRCLYGMVEYCVDVHRCRREMIACHFDEVWDRADCDRMCDHCRAPREPKQVDVTKHCRTVYKLLGHAASSDTKLTVQKLLDAWYGKGPAALKLAGISPPSFPRETAENILAHLLIVGYLKEDFHFTPYSTISYIRRGQLAPKLEDPSHTIGMTVRGKSIADDKSVSPVACGKINKASDSTKRKKTPNEESGKSKKPKVYVIDSDSD
uniref:ATP-dependent DNA helicase n=1 Tax=Graphocephala atropunctata TaxID=36148 RepID=A0A1B6M5M1_9HEMI